MDTIIVVDQLRVLSESKAGIHATEQLKTMAERRAGEIRPAMEALEAEKKSLEAQISLLKPGDAQQNIALRERTQSFSQRSQDFENRRQRIGRELERTRQETYNKLFEILEPVLKELAGKTKAAVVLEKRAVLYSIDSVDVTDEAIVALDAVTQTLAVEWVSSLPPEQQSIAPTSTTPAAAPSLK